MSRKLDKASVKPVKKTVQLVIGARIRELRLAKKWTQEFLAEEADLHTNYVSSVERGERNVSAFNIVRLAFALDVPAAALLQAPGTTSDSIW